MTQRRLEIPTSDGGPTVLLVEPWGQPIPIPAGAVVHVAADGPAGGELVLDTRADGHTIWGWSGATIEVFVGGEPVYASEVPVPATPDGIPMKRFFEVLGLAPTTDRVRPGRRV